jgi:hypothetical protein
MKHWDRYLDGVPNIIRQFCGVGNFFHKIKYILRPGVALSYVHYFEILLHIWFYEWFIFVALYKLEYGLILKTFYADFIIPIF